MQKKVKYLLIGLPIVLLLGFFISSLVMFQLMSGSAITAWGKMEIPRYEFSQAPHESSDREALEALYSVKKEGWAKGDAGLFASPFLESSDFVAFDGTHLRGRQAIIDFHAPLFTHTLKGSTSPGQIEHVHFIRPDVAVLHTRGAIIEAGSKEADFARDSLQSLVAVKNEGQWAFVSFHNTRVRPMGRHYGATMLWMMFDGLWNFFGSHDD